jgi:hypothetical protein
MPNREKRYVHLEGLLHEPFNDIGCEAFFDALGDWLNRLNRLILGRSASRTAA